MTSKHRLILISVAVSLPAVLTAFFIGSYGVNVPYYDQWRFVPVLDKWYSGTLTWSDLFAFHNAHRILVPRLVMIASASATQWDTRAEMWIGYVLLVCTAGMLLRAFLRGADTAADPGMRLLGFLPIALLLFSLRQWENFLLGWQIAFFLCVFSFTLAMTLLDHHSRGSLILAMVMGVAASFSLFNGLLVWPTGLLKLLLQRRNSGGNWTAWAWILVGAAVTATYFVGFTFRGATPGGGNLVAILVRFFVGVGSPLAYDSRVLWSTIEPVPRAVVAIIAQFGVLIVAVTAYAVGTLRASGGIPTDSPWIYLALFGALSEAMIAGGRLTFGVQQALSPKYTTIANLLIIGTFGLLGEAARRKGGVSVSLLNVLTIVIILASVTADLTVMDGGKYARQNLHQWACAVRHYETMTDNGYGPMQSTLEEIKEYSRVLERHRLSVFGRSQPQCP